MKPGRIPKPTALKLIQGNPGHRPIEKNKSEPEIKVPDYPQHLTSDAKAEWQRITPLLIKYNLISEIDTASLALYCQSYGRWQQAERKISELIEKGGDGMLIKAPSGYPIQNPYLAIANRAMEDCYKYLQQFGLSPSARTRVTVTLQGDLFDNDKKNTNYFT